MKPMIVIKMPSVTTPHSCYMLSINYIKTKAKITEPIIPG